jgi:hypothetical protein
MPARKGSLLTAFALTALFATAPSASAQVPFTITQFAADVSTSLAGAHPDQTTSFRFPLDPETGHEAGHVRDIVVNLPAGLLGDATALPQCSPNAFSRSAKAEPEGCLPETQAGITTVLLAGAGSGKVESVPIFNVVPRAGEVARFGFSIAGVATYIDITVRTSSDYGLTATSANINDGNTEFYGASVTLWGVPADPSHDTERYFPCTAQPHECRLGAPSSAPLKPLLTNPTTCPGAPLTASLGVDTFEQPGEYVTATTEFPTLTGCAQLAFNPSIVVSPETTRADSPSGYSFDLSVPQDGDPNGRAVSHLRKAVVTLPPGVTLDPSVASGLQGCTDEQFGMGASTPPSCPDGSVLGTTEVDTPVLPAPLFGHAYVGQPLPGNTYRIFLDVQGDSLDVKLQGRATPDPVTGQITATFENLPQTPFSDFKLHLKGGDTAALATPPVCGQGAAATALTPWSGNPDATPQSILTTDFDGHGGACPASLPFAPSFSAGSSSLVAGADAGFSLTLARADRTQYLGGLSAHLPPGLLARLASVALCQIGTVSASAGAGATPFTLAGRVYLAAPRVPGSPASLSVVVPAIAGPYNLGDVIVGADIVVNNDGSITATSDPLPTIVQGVPLRIRQIALSINRAGFMINPTSCDGMSVTATITSTQGQPAGVSSPFQLADCGALGFSPSFAVSTAAHTSKQDGASLDVKVAQTPGQANIHKVDVRLPVALPSRLTTLQHACTSAQFVANPAGCPQASDVGIATAVTPLLAHPLTGPAFLVSHGGAAFPDLVIVLQGEGITIELTGNTDIKKGVTYSRFETVPDAPISSFELKLPEGPNSVLAANGNLCLHPLVMATAITGANGDAITQNTTIAVTGCKVSKPLTRAQLLAKALTTCRKTYKHKKQKRVVCEARARKTYAAKITKKSGTKATNGKGTK